MGIKGKLLKRFKRTRPKSSDASVDNTTIATKEVHPSTPIENGHQYLIDPTPIRLPVLGLVDGDVPSTPKPVSSGNGQQVSPDHTNSTKSSSIQSDEKQDADTIVPDMNTMEDNKNIFTELTDRAFGLVKMSSDLSDASKKVAIGEFTGDGVNKKEAVIVPDTSSADQVEIQRASSAVEFTSDPVDLDGGGSVRSNRSSSTSGSGRKSVKLEEKARSSESRVSSFGRLFGESLEKVDEAERQDVNVDKVQEVTKDDTEITEEEEPIRNSTSWVRDIEKHALNKSPSDDGEKKTRQVSFDSEEHHIEDDYVTYEDEESSYDSSEFDDDSQYYDDQYEGGNNDDDIDEATYMSGDSMMLTENDGLWGWLCGYGNFNLSPGSLEDQTDDKSVGTSVHSSDSADTNDSEGDEGEELSYRQVKAVRTMSSSKMSRKLRVVSPAPRLPSLLKKKEPKPETVSTPTPQEIKEVESEQVSPEAPKEKKEIKPKEQPQEQKSATKTQTAKEHFNGATTQPEKDQPRDFQGFPVKVNILPKKSAKLTQSTKSAQDAKKKEQDPPDDATAATSTSKSKSNVSSKDSRQLEVYCKGHGGAENLVLRKYPTIPSPAGKNHVLVKVEASTVSSRDCLLRLQGDPKQPPQPSVPGFQIVGTIHSLGEGLKSNGDLQVGDRVAALTQGGGNARFVSIPASTAILLPPTATNENTVCLVSNYMTAYQALKMAKMKKGGAPLTNSNVLITGGSGPIGQALIDLANREGAIVHTTAHQMHQDHLTKNLRAEWYPVNPNKWLPKLEGQMDVVVDSLCVDGYESSYRALATDGVLICTGNISAAMDRDQSESFFESKKLSLWWSDVKARHMWRNCYFYNIYESYASDPKLFQQELLYLYLQMENGGIKPKVAGRVSLNQVPKAQRLIEKGLPNGTVILNPWKKLDPKQNVPIEKCGNRSK